MQILGGKHQNIAQRKGRKEGSEGGSKGGKKTGKNLNSAIYLGKVNP